ncbi:hypothetical protein [Nocardia pneumoniae]|uniref:hypothetical protein n=1 Tax=Nocardia pneumoniae TaxID=228601 RepID=UPI0005939993|nr:hypothetical protein [Nocardia pneumoniae]
MEIAAATDRPIAFVPISRTDFVAGLTDYGVPADTVSLLDYLFGTLFDGRNAAPADGVRRALGREPKDFADHVETVLAEVWNVPAR